MCIVLVIRWKSMISATLDVDGGQVHAELVAGVLEQMVADALAEELVALPHGGGHLPQHDPVHSAEIVQVRRVIQLHTQTKNIFKIIIVPSYVELSEFTSLKSSICGPTE